MAGSTSAQPLSKHQAFWRARRKQRVKSTPQRILVTAGFFVCISVAVEVGVFSYFGIGPEETQAVQEWQTVGPSQSLALTEDELVTTNHRQLLTFPTLPSALSNMNLSTITCPGPKPSSSTFPTLGSIESNKPIVTLIAGSATLYMFLGLAIVCDSFFEASLSAICEKLNLKDDVAGATFMAAGGSAPELATSIIGVFISQSDVGFGTIVGSAVFNVLFVIACCAFVAPDLKLTWWPLARDASFYCFSLALIVIFVSNDMQIHVWEASFLLLSYGLYVLIMYYNERLEEWVTKRVRLAEMSKTGCRKIVCMMIEHPIFVFFLFSAIAANAVMVVMEMMEFNKAAAALPCFCGINVGAALLPFTTYFYINLAFNAAFVLEMLIKFFAYGFFGYWKIPLNCFDGSLVFLIIVELVLTFSAKNQAQLNASNALQDANNAIGVGIARMLRLLKFVRFVRLFRLLRVGGGVAKVVAASGSTTEPTAEEKPEKPAEGEKPEGEAAEEEEEDDDDDEPFNPFEMWGDTSSPGGIFGLTMWFIGLPLSVGMWLTIPDCRRETRGGYWFVFTFSNCIIWIALLSAVMVWMMERVGEIYKVPPSIMGLFILAAGTSIPDCLSSVAVARRGHGDMAVSSSIGSNIFDVLIGLPIPWFMYTAIVRPAIGPSFGPQWVKISSEALAVMILMLFVMVALVVTTVHLSGWILSVKLGMGMMTLYLCFMILAILLDPISGPVIFPNCKCNGPGLPDCAWHAAGTGWNAITG